MDHSEWPMYRHRIVEVMADRVSKAKSYSDYIKNSEFETMNVVGQENISRIQRTENISGTSLLKIFH